MSIPQFWAYALEIQAHTGAEVVKLYFSSSPALVTGPGDTPPNTTFQTGLLQPGNYAISSFQGGKTFGAAQIGYGEIVIDNPAGIHDVLLDYAFDGRPSILRRIDPALIPTSVYPDDWTIVYAGTLSMVSPTMKGYNQGAISIQWRDKMAELGISFPLAVFVGNNQLPDGLEGTVNDLKSKNKPLILGKVYEVSPVCVNTSKLIYAASPPINGFLDIELDWDGILNFDAVPNFFGNAAVGRSGIANATVYDSGVIITQGAVYADEAELLSVAPAAGTCRILPSNGYIRFGTIPVGLVTLSCTDNGTDPHLVGSLFRSILTDYLHWDSSKYNNTELVALDSACPLEMGTYINDEDISVSSVLNRFATSAGVCYYFDTNGVFRSFQVADPINEFADFVLENAQIANLARLHNDGVPAKAVRLKYQKCWSVQTSGVAGSVSAEHRAWIATEWRQVMSYNNVTAMKYLLSQNLEFETAFAEDAQTEAVRRKDLYSVRRDFFEITIVPELFDFTSLHLGMVGEIQLSGRFGYTAKNMLLIGITADLANGKITLTLWG